MGDRLKLQTFLEPEDIAFAIRTRDRSKSKQFHPRDVNQASSESALEVGRAMTFRSRPGTILVAFTMLIAGCGATTASPASALTEGTAAVSPPAGIANLASIAPVSSLSAAVTTSWVKPAAGATVKDYELTFAVTTSGGDVSEVGFKIAWSGGSFAGCSAKQAAAGGTWSCTADLLRFGVPPGALKVSVDVLDANGKVIKGLIPARSIIYAAVPPKPGTTFRVVSKVTSSGQTEVDELTWTEPVGYATEFRLYGVTGCLNYSAATDGQPCLVEHMPLPAKNMVLIKKVSGTTRSLVLKHTWDGDGLCGDTLWCSDVGSLVLGAYNTYGQSVYAIVASTPVCYECVY